MILYQFPEYVLIDMPTVEVVVSDGQKANWKIFVEKTSEGKKYDSVSDLVRSAVEEQIARELGQEGVPEEIEDMFFDIQSQFENLHKKLSLANESLQVLNKHNLDEDTVDHIVGEHTKIIQEEIELLQDEVESVEKDD